MAIWDTLRDTAHDLVNKAREVIARVGDPVKDILAPIKARLEQILPEIAEQASVTIEETTTRAQEIADSLSAEVQVLEQKIVAAEREHNETWRNELLAKYAAELNTTSTRIKEALDKSGAMYSSARSMENIIRDLINRQILTARERAAELTDRFADVRDIATDVELAVQKVLSGEKELIEVVLPKSSAALDKIRDLFGYEIIPGEKKVVFALPAGAARQVIPRLTPETEKVVARVLAKLGMKDYEAMIRSRGILQFDKVQKMTPEAKAAAFGALSKTTKGKELMADVSRARLKDMAKKLPLKERALWLKSALSWTTPFLLLFFIAREVWSTPFMLGWGRKEGPEVIGIVASDAMRDGRCREALDLATKWKSFNDTLRDQQVLRLVEKFPVYGIIFEVNWKAQDEAARAVIRAAKECIANEEPEAALITVKGVPQDANVYINGAWFGKVPVISQEHAPGELTINVRLEGWETATFEYKILPGAEVNITVDLTPMPDTFWEELEERRKQDRAEREEFFGELREEKKREQERERELWIAEQQSDGFLLVESIPDAEIWIGGIDAGQSTPARILLAPGTYSITLKAPGYFDDTSTAIVKAGIETVHSRELSSRELTEREQEKGYLSVTTLPMGAHVFIDGAVQQYPTPVRVDLDPGIYNIVVRKPGYEDATDRITISAGEVIATEYDLIEIPREAVWRVNVSSVPPGGKLLVDGFFTDEWTPGFVDLLAGTYEIEVVKTGFIPASEIITIP